jgi:UDP-N-acetylmuramoylalanine--D-glutamate ligase
VITPSIYHGKTVAVLGLGKSGLSAARALQAAGALVLAWDDLEQSHKNLSSLKLEAVDLMKADWSKIECLVMSPGIPHTFPTPHPVSEMARKFNCPIICDVELLIQAQPNAKYIAITGTNGKSTTTSLIAHILNVAGCDVQVGGNLGIPALDLEPLKEDGIYVLEMSSYQLERTPSLVCDVAVLLNITPDHLSRHGTMQGYIQAKKNIFNAQTAEQFCIIGVDDEHSLEIFNEQIKTSKAKSIPISAKGPVEDGIFSDEDILIDEAFSAEGEQVMDLSALARLRGQHNQQNVAAAYGACLAIGAAPEWIVRGIASFPGLEHRQELVDIFKGVTFINDSKATNADAASKALSSYSDIYWIAGGQPKEGGINDLLDQLSNIHKAYLIGDAESAFAQTLEGKLDYMRCQTLEVATKAAFKDAAETGGVVLLSPACASWDQFTSFEARGNAFKDIVYSIIEEAQA